MRSMQETCGRDYCGQSTISLEILQAEVVSTHLEIFILVFVYHHSIGRREYKGVGVPYAIGRNGDFETAFPE